MRSKAAPHKVYFTGGKLPKEAVRPCDRLKGLSGMGLPMAGRLSPSRSRLLAARDAFSSLQTQRTACSGLTCKVCTVHRCSSLSCCGRIWLHAPLQATQLYCASFSPWLGIKMCVRGT